MGTDFNYCGGCPKAVPGWGTGALGHWGTVYGNDKLRRRRWEQRSCARLRQMYGIWGSGANPRARLPRCRAHFALATRDTCPTRFFADTPVINLWSMLLFMRPASAFVNAEPLSAVFIQVLRRTFADFHIIQKRRTALNLLVPDKWQPARYTHI